MKLTGGKWSKGDGIAALTLVAAILAVPGMPKLFDWDQPVHSPNWPGGTSPTSLTLGSVAGYAKCGV